MGGVVFFLVVLFEQLFWYNLWDNLVILSSYWSIIIEREKERGRLKR